MYVFFDTEFYSLVQHRPISIGFYAEKGQFQWYGEFPFVPEQTSDFVKAHVLPMLGPKHYPACRQSSCAKELQAQFLRDLERQNLRLEDLTFVADYQGDFDILHSLMDGFIIRRAWAHEILPESLNSSCIYFNALLSARNTLWAQYPTLQAHHALYDARALEIAHEACWIACAY